MVKQSKKTVKTYGVAVLVDRRLPKAESFIYRFLPVIQHWKFPYRFIDVHSKSQLESLRSANAIFVFQPGIGRKLSKEAISCVERATRTGVGLFIGDAHFLKNPHLKTCFGSFVFPSLGATQKIKGLKVRSASHYISQTKSKNEKIYKDSVFHVPSIKGSRRTPNRACVCRKATYSFCGG